MSKLIRANCETIALFLRSQYVNEFWEMVNQRVEREEPEKPEKREEDL